MSPPPPNPLNGQIFIDEFDSIGGARGGGDENETSRQIKTQLMTEMQGVGDNMKGILVLAATNCPYSLDAAFRRRCAPPPPFLSFVLGLFSRAGPLYLYPPSPPPPT